MKSSSLSFSGLECIQPVDAEITGGYTSDLLSDVMAHLKEGDALITIQAHKNTVAVAALTGATAIIFCHGRNVDADVIEAAAKENIALFVSSLNQFDTTCALASALGR
ncbi:MAG: DRTGG domain-containing protein [Kiritimatiellales bacterium]